MLVQKPAFRRSARPRSAAKPSPTEFSSMEDLRRTFPKSFPKNGSMNLRDKKTIRKLPHVLDVTDTITVSGCVKLEMLSACSADVYYIEAEGCVSLKRIDPKYASFRGFMDLSGCEGLEVLPDEMKVTGSGSLILKDCMSLTDLPEGLEVDGKLVISGCTGLTRLPAYLKAGFLDMQGCVNIEELPATVSCTAINLRGCDNIRIPQSFVDRMIDVGSIKYPDRYEIFTDAPIVEAPSL